MKTSLVLAALAIVGASAQKCSLSSHCPKETPCCSQYGDCGVGAYCLGGCDPQSSFTLDSCVPEPVCRGGTFTFKDMSRIMSKDKYLGDSSQTDWVMDGKAVTYQNTALLTMPPQSVGTVLASTFYMWYGNVKARFRTSRGAGVVTAFILLSDVKDEIDYEFVGVDLMTAQTNFYSQGITNYANGMNITMPSSTYDNFHDYEIQWTPDTITWLVDGQVGRTKNRKDTWNSTSNQWGYPQTPARVQLSIWPGGLASNGQGTIDWAGGLIDWNSQDIQQDGYYYAQFESVTVECFNANSAPGTNKNKSYYYNNAKGTNDTVVDSNKDTVLSSFLATGTNMTAGANSVPSGVATVPGNGNGTSPTGNDAHDNGSGSGSSSSSSGTDSSSSGGSAASSASSAGATGFSQGTAAGTKSAAARVAKEGRNVVGGSVFAVVVALGVLTFL
jgi:beta-glucanase (GH16 family)